MILKKKSFKINNDKVKQSLSECEVNAQTQISHYLYIEQLHRREKNVYHFAKFNNIYD